MGLGGPTGAVLDRSLIGLRALIDRSLAAVRLGATVRSPVQLISLADFIADVELSATLEARSRRRVLKVSSVDRRLAVEADREMLFSAVKFTQPGTEVSMNAYASADRIRIDVEDHCGGLPPGDPELLFQPFTQGSRDKSGVGLGLSICRRSVEANRGVLRVHNVPGCGCVFSIHLPRYDLSDAFEAERVKAAGLAP